MSTAESTQAATTARSSRRGNKRNYKEMAGRVRTYIDTIDSVPESIVSIIMVHTSS